MAPQSTRAVSVGPSAEICGDCPYTGQLASFVGTNSMKAQPNLKLPPSVPDRTPN